jgi:predicted DCC family thiol-disulfide oxidoreductase YuxK
MIELGRQNYFLFDGDCGICSYAAEVCQRMDRRQQFVVVPYQSFAEDELRRFGLSYAQCAHAVQTITRRGRVYAGAFAVNYFLWRQFPWSLLVLVIYAIPPLLVLELIGYRLIANNRQRLSQWLGMKACLLKR